MADERTHPDPGREPDPAIERGPGAGDPTRLDDRPVDGLRRDLAGTAGPGLTSPAPGGDAPGEAGGGHGTPGPGGPAWPAPGGADQLQADPAEDPSRSGPLGGQFGSAGGGYGSGSADMTSGGSPDGEDVQAVAGPGPQTDWLRGAPGGGDGDGERAGGGR